MLSVNGSVGWIGTILVEPAWRRRGVGMALTQATIDTAESAGCRTLLLVATDAGRPLYEKIGFEVQTWYRILEAPGLGDEPIDPRIRPFAADDLAAMARSRPPRPARTGRTCCEHSHRPRRRTCLVRDDGTLGGFVVRRRGAAARRSRPASRTPRRSSTPAVSAAGRSTAVRAGLLVENEAGLGATAGDRLDRFVGAPRLIRGDPLHWQPEAIWGQFNHALG